MLQFRCLMIVLCIVKYCSPEPNCPKSREDRKTILNCSGLGLPTKIDNDVNYIDLSRNNFVKLRIDFFKNFTNNKIKDLVLANCGIQEVEKEVFMIFYNLEHLDLSSNNIRSFDPAVFKLQRLLKLTLSHNPLHILKTGSFDSIPNLAVLHLSSCALEKIEREAFLNVPNLRTISLDNNNLTKLSNMSFSKLNLTQLQLSGNPWECDCNLKWLKKWGVNSERYIELKMGRCNNPPRIFDDIPLEEFACEPVISHPHLNVCKASGSFTNETLSCKVDIAEKDEVNQTRWTWTASNHKEQRKTIGEWSNLTVNIKRGEWVVYTCNVSNPRGSDSRSFTFYSTDSGDKEPSTPETNKWWLQTVTTVVIITFVVVVCLVIIWHREKSQPLPDEMMYQPREDLINSEAIVTNPVEKAPRLYESQPPDASEISGLLPVKKEEDDEFDRVSVASVTTTNSHRPYPLQPRYTPDLLTFPEGFSTTYLPSQSPSPPSVIVPHTRTHSSLGLQTNGEYFDRAGSPSLPLSRFDSTPTLFNYCTSPTREALYGTRHKSDTSSLYNYRPLPEVPPSRGQYYPHPMYRSLPRGGGHRPPAAIPRGGTMPRTLSAEVIAQHNRRHSSQHRIPPNTRRYVPSVLYEVDNETYETIV